MNNILKNRTTKLQKKISEKSGIQENSTRNTAILISSSSDIIYFTNFEFLVPEEREAFLFITKNSVNLIHTSFAPVDNFEHINYLKGSFPNQLADHVKKIATAENITGILIDNKTLFVAELDAIQDRFPKEITIKNYDEDMIESFKNIKEPDEIEKISKACKITSQVMKSINTKLYEGITEIEVKKTLNKLFEDNGADELAFPTIVAFGSNSALPHHQPGNTKLQNNMVVLIDMGAKIDGYCADMTRTFWFGDNPSKKFLEIKGIVDEAYQAGFEVIMNNNLKLSAKSNQEFANKQQIQNDLKDPNIIKAKDIDNAARNYISSKGYGDKFYHTTGHGLGISIHEQPSISWRNETEIKPGMTITIEPGIYLENEFGIRYENTILVMESGAVELTIKD